MGLECTAPALPAAVIAETRPAATASSPGPRTAPRWLPRLQSGSVVVSRLYVSLGRLPGLATVCAVWGKPIRADGSWRLEPEWPKQHSADVRRLQRHPGGKRWPPVFQPWCQPVHGHSYRHHGSLLHSVCGGTLWQLLGHVCHHQVRGKKEFRKWAGGRNSH